MKLDTIQGDITKFQADAIVNAANSSLLGGGGVDGAIHRAGGPEILDDCKKIVAKQGGCPTGEAVITTAGRLPAKHVIHTVGPVWHGGQRGEPELLANCYRNSLLLAEEHQLASIAFPGISTGVYGYPKQAAAEIAVTTVREMTDTLKHVREVTFVYFDTESEVIYRGLLGQAQ
ncbi:MAG TPA: O-acetyl-ADP-ribose deacetylase [Flavobacteriales bacterium]|nr:O-acetyl-ADP-ribose deacetylase [Flavobacteriales bacterium]